MVTESELVLNQAVIENLTDTLTRREELLPVPDFRIASYNVHNLFGPDHVPTPGRNDEPASEQQLEALAETIISLNADAIAFQEVESEKVLSQLFRERINEKLKRRGRRRFDSFVCIPSHDPRGINVALATRFDVRATLSFQDREFGDLEQRAKKFSRDLLGVEMYATPSYRFLFFVAHLKSKMGGDPSADKRALEAKEIRSILEGPVFGGNAYIKQPMVLTGDMNDDPDTEVIDLLRGSGKMSLKDILEDLDDNHTYPTHKKYRRTRLDYIFASRAIEITEYNVHRDETAQLASDHYPIWATVKVPQ